MELEMKVTEVDDYKFEYGGIVPNFIYNRVDLWQNKADIKAFVVSYQEKNYKIFFKKECNHGEFYGIWLSKIPSLVVKVLAKHIFLTDNDVKFIRYKNALVPYEGDIRKNHFRIVLPNTIDDLDRRQTKKSRYNLKRQKRLLEENFGNVVFASNEIGNTKSEILNRYFELKKVTHNIKIDGNTNKYVVEHHVSHVYTLAVGGDVKAIIFSCEDSEIVYIENITYDTSLGKYSPGLLLYNWYLKQLVLKGKKEIYLEGGNLEYKRRYGSIEEIVYEGKIYRSWIKQILRGIRLWYGRMLKLK